MTRRRTLTNEEMLTHAYNNDLKPAGRIVLSVEENAAIALLKLAEDKVRYGEISAAQLISSLAPLLAETEVTDGLV